MLEEMTNAAIDQNAEFIASLPDRYGEEPQFSMAIEEMAELIQALEKHRRYKSDPEKIDAVLDNVAEEMADVRILLAQLSHIFGNDDAVAAHIQRKLDRQRQRIAADLN